MSLKKICICLILIFCIIGAASAAEDVSTDVVDASDDAVAVDAVSEDVSDSLESVVVEDEPVVVDSASAQDEIENILKDDSAPTVLYVNISKEDTDDPNTGEQTVSGADWENAYGGTFALTDAISNIGNNGVIYLASGTYKSFNGGGEKNYTLIGLENTIIAKKTTQDNTNGGIHTCINIIFNPTTFIMNNSRIDCERVFINCTIKAQNIRLANGNIVEESTGLMRFEDCVFEDYNTFIDVGMHANVTFNNCIFKNIEADSLIKVTSNLAQYVNLTGCTFENCVMNGVVNLIMDTDVTDYVAIENCNYDFDATLDVISSEDNENHYVNATKFKSVAVDSAVDISSSEKGVVVIALTDNSSAPIAGATVKYTVNGGEEQTDVTGEDGKFTITGLTGEVTIAVSYEGNESFNPITGTNTFNFTEEPATNDTNGTNDTPAAPTKVATKLTAPKVTATYNIAKKLVITLKDANGKALANKKVTVKVGTISKTLKTNSKGQVSVAVNTLVPKTYTATIKFAGDNDYKASSLSAKVTVKKAAPKLTATKKTFKVKAKTKKVTATLKNNKGKVLKKVKLTLKIGKKTYTAKTNSKGVATFKVKLTKKGTYTGTVKFAGNKYFKAATKKVKIVVKK